jgi:hypothetical protein
MDDPRSEHSLMRSDEDVQKRGGLMAQYNECTTLEQWQELIRRSAISAQSASLDLREWSGWRSVLKSARRRLRRAVGIKRHW